MAVVAKNQRGTQDRGVPGAPAWATEPPVWGEPISWQHLRKQLEELDRKKVYRYAYPDGSKSETTWQSESAAKAWASVHGHRYLGEVRTEPTVERLPRDIGSRGTEPALSPPPLVQAEQPYSPPPLVQAEPPYSPPPLIQAESPPNRLFLVPWPQSNRINDEERKIKPDSRALNRSAREIASPRRRSGNRLGGSQERGVSTEGNTLANFIELLRKGPANQSAAPTSVTLPPELYAALRQAADAAYADGAEHGGIFGYFAGERIQIGLRYVHGKPDKPHKIEFPPASEWPALQRLVRFHTHLHEQADQGGGSAGGGHSGTDLANFIRNPENASIVFAQTTQGSWKIYFLLKTQAAHLPGTPKKIGEEYDQRVTALKEKGVDPIQATELQLKDLAQQGTFVFYSSVDSPTLARQP